MAAAVVILAVVVFALVMHSRRRHRHALWLQNLANAADEARTARELLPLAGSAIADPVSWTLECERVERAATHLDAVAAATPASHEAVSPREAAQALRGVVVALESGRQHPGQPELTPQQLAEADAATQARRADLDSALDHVDALLGSQLSHAPAPG